MLHITCDLCGKGIHPGESHYVVRVEVYAAHDPSQLTEADLEEDHMEVISQLLQDQDENQLTPPLEPTSHQLRYDLCPDCRARYLENPLNKGSTRETAPKLGFSPN
jgi:hypothetical protein